jgi:hypothetical protein
MSELPPDEGEDEAVTDSGGTMRRLRSEARDVVPDVALLASERRSAYDDDVRPAGGPPYVSAGEVITWHYGMSADVLRVVRDDVRGLVAWLPSGSEQLASLPVDGRRIRDRPLSERFTAPRTFQVRQWRGPGILRVAPTGCAWSYWYFFDDGAAFEGHYVNLELPHERPVDGTSRTHTRDLILDLWVEQGQTWVKDEDELDAAVDAGRYSPGQAQAVHDIAEQARREQIDPRAWPLDEGWEDWRPPAGWDEPLGLPAHVLEAVSGNGAL